jgi:hypothetical protein
MRALILRVRLASDQSPVLEPYRAARLTLIRSISVRAMTSWVDCGECSPRTAITRHSGTEIPVALLRESIATPKAVRRSALWPM